MKSVLRRNNVNISGNGKQAIVFAHGLGCDQHAWKRITDAFATGYTLVLFDFVGSGHSELAAYNKQRYSSLYGYAQDIIEICEELKISDAIFIGHSVSCIIGALAAIKSPSLFKKLVFVAPNPRYINEAGYLGGFGEEEIEALYELMDYDYFTWSRNITSAIMGRDNGETLGDELGNSFCKSDPEITKSFVRVTFSADNRKDLTQITMQTLILQCADDMLAPPEVGTYMQSVIPESTLVNLRATGHCPHMSAPAETIEAIRSFIE